MLANICTAAWRPFLRRSATAAVPRNHGPARPLFHALEALEPRTLCSAAPTISTVSITTLDGHATQSGTPAVFAITRTAPYKTALTVDYETVDIPGVGAIAGQDYPALPGAITIPAGKATVEIKVKPLANAPKDGAKALELELLPGAGATYKTNPLKVSAGASINSTAIMPWASIISSAVLTGGPSVITEGLRPGEFVIGISSNLDTQESSVAFTISGTAPSSRYTLDTSPDGGTTFTPIQGDVVPFAPGATDVVIYVVAPNDGIAEPSQTVTLTLTGATGCNIQPTAASATLSIQDLNANLVLNKTMYPVTAKSNSPITFPLNITIINSGPTPSGLFNVAVFAVNALHPYDPNYQNYVGTVNFPSVNALYPTEGIDPGQEETEALSSFSNSVTPGTYELLIVINPTPNDLVNGVQAGAGVYIDPTTFDVVL